MYTAAMEILREDLQPKHLLHILFAQKLITSNEKRRIEREETDSDRVSKLLTLLRRKPVDAHCYFMEHLDRMDQALYKQLEEIETRKRLKALNAPCPVDFLQTSKGVQMP